MKSIKHILVILSLVASISSCGNSNSNNNPQKYGDGTNRVISKEIASAYIDSTIIDLVISNDFYALIECRKKAIDILNSLTINAFALNEKPDVENLLTAPIMEISPTELLKYKRVRSIQITSSNDGIFSYPYFNCRFIEKEGKIFFEKTKGSQRKSGYIYKNTPNTMIFLGGWTYNDNPQTTYGSENSIAGILYKIGENKLIMIFIEDKNRFEIYEIIP